MTMNVTCELQLKSIIIWLNLLTWQIEESEHNIPLFNDGGESFISQCLGQLYVQFDSPCSLYSLCYMIILCLHYTIKHTNLKLL